MICRSCKSSEVYQFLDMGLMPLAGGFLKREEIPMERKYPLDLWFCSVCKLVQIGQVIPPSTLFMDYKYLSSSTATLRAHFEELADRIAEMAPKRVFEVGSNDGVLLAPLLSRGVPAVGIEPASNIAAVARSKGLTVETGWFGADLARRLAKRYGQCSVLTGSNVFAHMPDLDDILAGIQILLEPKGILMIEVHSLFPLVRDLQYDFFYHEHVFYWSLAALKRFLSRGGFQVFRVEPIPIHGGSIRIYATRGEDLRIQDSVAEYARLETDAGLDKLFTYLRFAKRVSAHRRHLRGVLSEGEKKIAGYGASGRATTLLNYTGIGRDIPLRYIVDDSPARQGLYMPGIHTPIVGGLVLDKDPPDRILLLAWTYESEVRMKTKLPFIMPFPDIHTDR